MAGERAPYLNAVIEVDLAGQAVIGWLPRLRWRATGAARPMAGCQPYRTGGETCDGP